MLLIIYNQQVCKEIMLPNLYNADYEVELSRDEYSLQNDLHLFLENKPDGWTIHATNKYRVVFKRQSVNEHHLDNQDIVNIETAGGESLMLLVSDADLAFRTMEKYDLNQYSKISIGKNPENMVCFDFMGLISSFHAELRFARSNWYIIDGSSNGVFVNNYRVNKQKELQFGDHIQIFGLHMVYLDNVLAMEANCGELHIADTLHPISIEEVDTSSLQRKTHEDRYFNRAPRNLPTLYTEEITIEDPPQQKKQKQKPAYMTIGPAFTMAIPMTLGFMMSAIASSMSGRSGGTFMYTGLITAFGSAIIGTIWAILNLNYSKKEAVEEETTRFNAYSNYLFEISNTVRDQYRHNALSMNQIYPPVSTVLGYNTSSGELWNRNSSHEDFLNVRIGSGDMPFQVNINTPKEKFSLNNDTLMEKPKMIKKEFEMLHNVPICVNLMEHRLIGLVGGAQKLGAIDMMHVMTAQIAAANSYTDVKLVYLFDENDKSHLNDWECMRWFPHVWSQDKSMRYMAGNETERRDIFFALSNVIHTRVDMAAETANRNTGFVKPHYIVFISDPSLLDGELLERYIVEPHEEYGMTAILLVESISQLPNSCEFIIQNDQRVCCVYNLLDVENAKKQSFVADSVANNSLETFGMALSNIKVREIETNSEVPDSLTFLDMYNAKSLSQLNVIERWRKNRTFTSMKALIGRKAGNADCYLDIHEKFHGPHGLIAGTTGSGKSETLQTYILSLAVNFSPDDVSFFIIDFKGGGMANLFNGLPHLAGTISNLSGNQVTRAMISIESENKRRQRIFAENGVNNINLYTKLYKNHEATIPLPHLFIIIDEFAELKREQPEFMAKLISVAQVGRSLGVHLILSTQKPSGTVDDNIWSNSKFRLCLRVQDRQDSNDMLHKPDAAFLTQAGRCYLQVGNDEIFELFQSGYSGAIYSEDNDSAQSYSALIGRTGKADLIGTKNVSQKNTSDKVKQKTQLEAVIEYLAKIAKENGYQNSSQLWMPVLSEEIFLNSLVDGREFYRRGVWVDTPKDADLKVTIGLYDDPHNQIQKPLEMNFSENGHLAIVGNAGSGKSTFMQTVAFELMMKYSPEIVNLYLIDFSGHRLVSFENAPHVGGIVTDDMEDRLDKFFTLLNMMMQERKEQLKRGDFRQYVKLNGYVIPAVFVFLDNYESFREKTNDKYSDIILRLSREGVSYGIYFLVSAAGFGMSAIPNRIADNIRTVMTLEQQDKFKYMDVMHVSHLELLPETNVKGRGLAIVDERILEFQTALAIKAEDDFSRGRDLETLSMNMRENWNGKMARRIPEIPQNPTLELLKEDERYLQAVQEKDLLPIGYNHEDASIYSMHLGNNYCISILGKSRSGKTNLLKIILEDALRKQADIAIVERDTSGYQRFQKTAEENGCAYLTTSAELYAYFEKLLPEFARRNKIKRGMMEQGAEDEEIIARMEQEKPIFIFIDQMKDFMEMVYHKDSEVGVMSGFLENITEKGIMHNIYFVGCIQQDDVNSLMSYRVYNNFVSYKKGIFIGGQISSQKLFNFQGIPFSEQNKTLKKGLGIVTDDIEEGNGIEIVIPLVK